MKVAIISSRYPSPNNPYNHMFVHMRCLEMKKQGQNVVVFVTGNEAKKYVQEGITVKILPALDIIKELKNYDILYLHLLNIYPFSKADGWPIYKYIMDQNIPFAMYVHGSEVQGYRARMFEFNYKLTDFLKWFKKDALVIPKMRKFLKGTVNRNNASFVFPSVWMKEELENNLNVKLQKKYSIIPNGIETKFFEFQDTNINKYKIISIRSLSQKVYDIEKTIEVLYHLPKEFTLDIYGEGIYKEQYLALIREKDLENRITIIPNFIEKDEMKKLFLNYGFYISTTRMDSQGVNMMEAMASGLIVVTTDNSSKKEFITDSKNGLLGTSADILSKKIVEVANDTSLFLEMAKKGRTSITNIDSSLTVKKELILLNKVASCNG